MDLRNDCRFYKNKLKDDGWEKKGTRKGREEKVRSGKLKRRGGPWWTL
jgi:hypothetical protein